MDELMIDENKYTKVMKTHAKVIATPVHIVTL